jgi:hypothetical protein
MQRSSGAGWYAVLRQIGRCRADDAPACQELAGQHRRIVRKAYAQSHVQAVLAHLEPAIRKNEMHLQPFVATGEIPQAGGDATAAQIGRRAHPEAAARGITP